MYVYKYTYMKNEDANGVYVYVYELIHTSVTHIGMSVRQSVGAIRWQQHGKTTTMLMHVE